MKKIIIFAGIFLPALVFGQLDRSVRPAAGKAPVINIKDSEVFTLANGLTVILSENHSIPKVTVQYFSGSDSRVEGSKAGISDLAGELIASGTTKRTKDQIDNEIDYIGADLNSSPTSVTLSCLTKHLDKGLDIMTDVLFHANFPETEFNRVSNRAESGLMSAKSDPGTMAENAERKANFPNHPFSNIMTETTLKNIKLNDIIAYYQATFSPKSGFLVVVGDMTLDQAKKMSESYFGNWEGPEAYKAEIGDGQMPKGNQVIFVKKQGAVQSVINIAFPVKMRTGNTNQVPLTVTNNILGGGSFGARLMQNLREDKAYTYGCYSSLDVTGEGSYISLSGNYRNEVTDSAITQMLYELDRIGDSYVTADELNLTKSSMAGGFARSLERPSTVARFAFNIIRYKLPKDYYQTYLQRLDAVSNEDVLTMAQTYMTAKNCNIIVVGNEEVLEKLKQFDSDGQITVVDAFGDPVKESKKADISKEQLIEKYGLAMTGTTSVKAMNKKLKKVKSFEEITEMSIPQANVKFTSTKVWIAPNLEGQKIEMNGMTMQKSYFDGETGASVSMQTGTKPMTEEEITAQKKSEGIIPELNYAKNGVETELVGMEELDGKEVYVLKVNDGKREVYNYYDKTSLMKVKTVTIEQNDGEAVEVTVVYSDFKMTDDLIMFPYTYKMHAGEMTFDGKTIQVTMNNSKDLSIFQ